MATGQGFIYVYVCMYKTHQHAKGWHSRAFRETATSAMGDSHLGQLDWPFLACAGLNWLIYWLTIFSELVPTLTRHISIWLSLELKLFCLKLPYTNTSLGKRSYVSYYLCIPLKSILTSLCFKPGMNDAVVGALQAGILKNKDEFFLKTQRETERKKMQTSAESGS